MEIKVIMIKYKNYVNIGIIRKKTTSSFKGRLFFLLWFWLVLSFLNLSGLVVVLACLIID